MPRKISTVGGSLRDVQVLAGHKALSTTQRYIEPDSTSQKRIVDLISKLSFRLVKTESPPHRRSARLTFQNCDEAHTILLVRDSQIPDISHDVQCNSLQAQSVITAMKC
jgi:hypothetical protein